MTIFIVIVQLQFVRKRQRITDEECDTINVSPEDYSIYVKNIPLSYNAINDDYDDDLKMFFE